ncbi:MAG: sigma-54-dependent Fis family transcriptional regulator [Myxococcales bacterium]|nr:sigma-54-dependent Fis family transcriptional regulator [Myxococcales bacterium]
MNGRILVVDDDRAMCDMIAADLKSRDFVAVTRQTGSDAWQALQTEDFDVVVTDLSLGGMSGIELCERIVANRDDLPVVLITAFGSMDTAIEAIRAGAYDYITKPFEPDQLALTIERAVRHRRLTDEVIRLRRVVRETEHFGPMVGRSRAMRQVYDLVERLAHTTATVLVTGESGTGKELIAKALHDMSARRDGQFVAINCAAMPENLLESELFGHARGAFTGARDDRDGLFIRADGGTLFLDEIGEMPAGMQAKLLRALQEQKVRPVGGDKEVKFDARLVCATNRDLESEVSAGRFREDLYYRINVVQIELPPLRSRGSDILLLAQHFLETYAARYNAPVRGIGREAAEKLTTWHWPGNVRELQNCIERAVALARFDHIGVDDLPARMREVRQSTGVFDAESPDDLIPIAELERRYILRALEVIGGNKTATADALGIDRKTLYRKLERYAEEGLLPGLVDDGD